MDYDNITYINIYLVFHSSYVRIDNIYTLIKETG